jgi:hypothetical protein
MNLPEKLAREIGRVAKLRERYANMHGMPQVNVKPMLHMIDAALERAFRAAGSGDITEQMASAQDLEGFAK